LRKSEVLSATERIKEENSSGSAALDFIASRRSLGGGRRVIGGDRGGRDLTIPEMTAMPPAYETVTVTEGGGEGDPASVFGMALLERAN
jgi:hypothetical protein